MGVDRLGPASYGFSHVAIEAAAAIGGPKEGAGPLAKYFDRTWPSELGDHDSFEVAERALMMEAQNLAVDKADASWDSVDFVMGGDLLDQLASTNFAARDHRRPLIGLFAACAVFTEAIGLAAMAIEGGGSSRVLAAAVSHHMAAERQFRFPIELGYQRAPTAAWTSTAAGACVLGRVPEPQPAQIIVESATFGRVVDWGSKDPNDMGTAMAPAAYDTICRHLEAVHAEVDDYDQIYTGDLGVFGVKLLQALAEKDGRDWSKKLNDCGRSLYDLVAQDVHNGGSGPGCSASVFSGFIFQQLNAQHFKRILLVTTGALFSPTTYQQGESIPSIAHAVSIARL